MSEIADILDRAADLIEPEGAWAQRYFGVDNPSGPCCVVGAVGRSIGAPTITKSEHWVDENLRPLIGMDAEALEDWNDEPERTQAEVVAKLREAAAKARTPQYALKNGRV